MGEKSNAWWELKRQTAGGGRETARATAESGTSSPGPWAPRPCWSWAACGKIPQLPRGPSHPGGGRRPPALGLPAGPAPTGRRWLRRCQVPLPRPTHSPQALTGHRADPRTKAEAPQPHPALEAPLYSPHPGAGPRQADWQRWRHLDAAVLSGTLEGALWASTGHGRPDAENL